MIAEQVRWTDCYDEISFWPREDRWLAPQRLSHERGRVRVQCPLRAQSWIEARFHEQAEKWDRETAHLSSPSQKASHPSYQAILGMGMDERIRNEVIRLLLSDLRDNRRPWFWALSFLTHENPITQADSGKYDRMIAAWVNWGKREGLL